MSIVNMEKETIITELKRIKTTKDGCLCGRGEDCENCDPDSVANAMRIEIDKLINRILYQ